MIDQEILTAMSRVALAQNLRVLQGYRFAPTERGHIKLLLDYMNPAPNTSWVDIGCGFGEPAQLMQELRPDLEFTLVNNNKFQLEQAPEHMPSFCCDMIEMPFREGTFDGAMFLYSLCQSDNLVLALMEAARVVRSPGRLFVFDYVRMAGDDELSKQHLAAQFMNYEAIPYVARAVGWRNAEIYTPEGNDAVFRSLFTDQALYDRIFSELVPVVWWATK